MTTVTLGPHCLTYQSGLLLQFCLFHEFLLQFLRPWLRNPLSVYHPKIGVNFYCSPIHSHDVMASFSTYTDYHTHTHPNPLGYPKGPPFLASTTHVPKPWSTLIIPYVVEQDWLTDIWCLLPMACYCFNVLSKRSHKRVYEIKKGPGLMQQINVV